MGWRDFFRRRPASAPAKPANVDPAPPGASAESWAAGDIAECVGCGLWLAAIGGTIASGPTRGDSHRVAAVDVLPAPVMGEITYLRFSRWPRFYAARDFRKIVPRAEVLERSDTAFFDLVKWPNRETV